MIVVNQLSYYLVMKILLLILGFLFSGGIFADMDYYCPVSYGVGMNTGERHHTQLIKEECERNNILLMYNPDYLPSVIADWCRFDREIHYTERLLTCVLYDNEPRENVLSKD